MRILRRHASGASTAERPRDKGRRGDRSLLERDAFIANAVVFIGTGLSIDLPRITHEPALILPAIAIVFVSRAVLVTAVFRDGRSRFTAFLAGMRGALPLALALALPRTVAHRDEILDAVFATVCVTLVLQGVPLQPVISRLYPSTRDRPRVSWMGKRLGVHPE